MTDLFLKIVNLSISACWLILAVLVLRFLLKKAPKWIMPLLWGVAALRLVCPFSIESAFSLIPSAETISPEVVHFDPNPTITSGVPIIDATVNPVISERFAAPVNTVVSVNPLDVFTFVMAWVWAAGTAALLIYALVSALRLRRKLAAAVLLRENIYESEFVDSPFVFGVVRPKIYLPMHMDEGTAAHVIAHERAHLARRDHWWKVLGCLVLALHWFNPLVWLAYILFCRDIELACDEKVVRTMGAEKRADYSQALLSCAAPKRAVAACPLAFGEGNIKTRVKSALHYKKPAFWVAAAAVLALVLVAVCFLTDPEQNIFEDGRFEIAEVVYTAPDYPYDTTILALPRGIELTEEKDGWKTVRNICVRGGMTGESGALWPDEFNARRVEKEKCYEKADEEILFSDDGWRGGMSAELLRRGNARVWRAGSDQYAESAQFPDGWSEEFWIFQQKDGTIYLASIPRRETAFRWVFRLARQDSPLAALASAYQLSYAVFDDPSYDESYDEVFADFSPWLTLSVDEEGGMTAELSDGECYYSCADWEEIDLNYTNFDSQFASGDSDWHGWTDVNAARLRRENARAWRGVQTAEDSGAVVPHAALLRQDELAAMDRWLLLQQADGSVYLALGYSAVGTHPYRWCIRLYENSRTLLPDYVLGHVVYDSPHGQKTYDEAIGGMELRLSLSRDLRQAMTAVLTGEGCSYPRSYWQEIVLTKDKFDDRFAFDVNERWGGESVWADGLGPGTLRQGNYRAWHGTSTDADRGETVSRMENAVQDELVQLDHWLLLQQRDGSVYLVLSENAFQDYRWVIALYPGDSSMERLLAVYAEQEQEGWTPATAVSVTDGLYRYEWAALFRRADGEMHTRLMLIRENGAGRSVDLGTELADEPHLSYRSGGLVTFRVLRGEEDAEMTAAISVSADGATVNYEDESASYDMELATADLDGDGLLERLVYRKTDMDEHLLCVCKGDEELYREALPAATEGVVSTAYFLCREGGRDMLLEYEVVGRQGNDNHYAYYYSLLTFENGKSNIRENGIASIYLNPNPNQSGEWTAEHRQFAERVNTLMDSGTLVAAEWGGELYLRGDAADFHCVSPFGEDESWVGAALTRLTGGNIHVTKDASAFYGTKQNSYSGKASDNEAYLSLLSGRFAWKDVTDGAAHTPAAADYRVELSGGNCVLTLWEGCDYARFQDANGGIHWLTGALGHEKNGGASAAELLNGLFLKMEFDYLYAAIPDYRASGYTREVLGDQEPIYAEGDYWVRCSNGETSVQAYHSAAGDRDSAVRFSTTDPNYETSRQISAALPGGVRIGTPRAQVTAAYSELTDEPYWDYEGDYLWYGENMETGLGRALIFWFRDGKVERIELNNMFD